MQAEDVHVQRGRAGKSRAGFGDSLHHQRGFGDAEACAAVLLRHGNAEPAIAGEGGVKVLRKAAFAVFFQPVSVIEGGADFLDGRADGALIVG